MPTYITLKEVKKRWGHGQEDIFPVSQFEKLWGDMIWQDLCRIEVKGLLEGQACKQLVRKPVMGQKVRTNG